MSVRQSMLLQFSLALSLALPVPPAARAAEDDVAPAATSTAASTQPAAASKLAPDAETAAGQARAAAGFKVELFAAEPHVANPVALSIDERGRVYVVETYRRRNAVLDVRKLPEWLDDDLACRTVADRIAMVRKRLSPEAVRKLTETEDRVRVVEDRDGDGVADYDSVFAGGFNALEDGTAAGVLARGNDVWFTDIPNLWHFRDADRDGKADGRTSLHYGYGVRYGYSGHDLHGLRFGPDGKLYFSIADRGLHVERDGKTLISNPDSGAVMRCNPDGSELELVHVGLRNPQELAFDEYGNLFTADNNSDGGDATRWVHVVEGGDSGWHVGHQWHAFPVTRGVWNSERLWDVNSPVPAYFIVPPIANPKISGPSGLTYAPGTGLPDAFAGRFLLVDFRGGAAGGSGVYALKNKPRGASFELAEQKELVTNILPTDVEFGYDGGVYVTDWVTGWEPTGRGRIFRVTDPKAAADPLVAQTRTLVAAGMTQRTTDELAGLLSHADQRVRQAAQFELATRADKAVPTLAALAAKVDGHQLARVHAIWALGQIAHDTLGALAPVLPLLADRDPEVRAQSAKVLGDAKIAGASDGLVKATADRNSPRVRFFAAQSLGKLGDKAAVPALVKLLERNRDMDAYVRHAAVTALARIEDVAALRSAAETGSDPVRMGALLALRKLRRPEVALLLTDPSPSIVLEAARAVNDETIEAAMPQLAAVIDRKPGDLPPVTVVPILSRALNANYRLGTPKAAAAVAAFAARPDAPDVLRIEALRMLASWDKPGGRDRVTGLWRPVTSPRDAQAARSALAPVLDKLLHEAPDDVRIAALSAGTATGVSSTPLYDFVADAKAPPALRAAALGAMAEHKDPRLADAAKLALSTRDETIRRAAVRVQPKLPGGGTKALRQVLDAGTPREQQAVLQVLAAVTGKDADAMLLSAFDRLAAGTLPPEAALDLLTSAATRKSGAVKSRLAAYESARPKGDPLAGYRETLAGGDAKAGEQVFRERADVSCMRCHAVNAAGGNAGPDLAGLPKRGGTREHILESILLPNAKIAPGFETVQVRTAAGDVVSGVLKAEDDRTLRVEVPEQGVVTVEKSQVQNRKGGLSAMPDDIAKTLSKEDLRDLVEYLAGL